MSCWQKAHPGEQLPGEAVPTPEEPAAEPASAGAGASASDEGDGEASSASAGAADTAAATTATTMDTAATTEPTTATEQPAAMESPATLDAAAEPVADAPAEAMPSAAGSGNHSSHHPGANNEAFYFDDLGIVQNSNERDALLAFLRAGMPAGDAGELKYEELWGELPPWEAKHLSENEKEDLYQMEMEWRDRGLNNGQRYRAWSWQHAQAKKPTQDTQGEGVAVSLPAGGVPAATAGAASNEAVQASDSDLAAAPADPIGTAAGALSPDLGGNADAAATTAADAAATPGTAIPLADANVASVANATSTGGAAPGVKCALECFQKSLTGNGQPTCAELKLCSYEGCSEIVQDGLKSYVKSVCEDEASQLGEAKQTPEAPEVPKDETAEATRDEGMKGEPDLSASACGNCYEACAEHVQGGEIETCRNTCRESAACQAAFNEMHDSDVDRAPDATEPHEGGEADPTLPEAGASPDDTEVLNRILDENTVESPDKPEGDAIPRPTEPLPDGAGQVVQTSQPSGETNDAGAAVSAPAPQIPSDGAQPVLANVGAEGEGAILGGATAIDKEAAIVGEPAVLATGEPPSLQTDAEAPDDDASQEGSVPTGEAPTLAPGEASALQMDTGIPDDAASQPEGVPSPASDVGPSSSTDNAPPAETLHNAAEAVAPGEGADASMLGGTPSQHSEPTDPPVADGADDGVSASEPGIDDGGVGNSSPSHGEDPRVAEPAVPASPADFADAADPGRADADADPRDPAGHADTADSADPADSTVLANLVHPASEAKVAEQPHVQPGSEPSTEAEEAHNHEHTDAHAGDAAPPSPPPPLDFAESTEAPSRPGSASTDNNPGTEPDTSPNDGEDTREPAIPDEVTDMEHGPPPPPPSEIPDVHEETGDTFDRKRCRQCRRLCDTPQCHEKCKLSPICNKNARPTSLEKPADATVPPDDTVAAEPEIVEPEVEEAGMFAGITGLFSGMFGGADEEPAESPVGELKPPVTDEPAESPVGELKPPVTDEPAESPVGELKPPVTDEPASSPAGDPPLEDPNADRVGGEGTPEPANEAKFGEPPLAVDSGDCEGGGTDWFTTVGLSVVTAGLALAIGLFMGGSGDDNSGKWTQVVEDLRAKNKEIQSEGAVLQQQLSQMKIKNDELSQGSQQSAAMQQQVAEMEAQIEALQANVQQWESYGQTVAQTQATTQQTHQAQVAELNTQIQQLTEQVQQEQAKSSQHTEAMQSLEEDAASTKAEAATMKMEAAKALNTVTSYEIKIGSLQKELTRLQAASSDGDGMKIAKLELERDQVVLQHKKAQTRIELLELEAQTARAARDKHSGEASSLQDKLESAETRAKDAEDKLEDRVQEFEEYKKSLEDPDGDGDDEGTHNDEDEGGEVDEAATRLKQLRRLLDRERKEKLQADANLHKAECTWRDQERGLQSSAVESTRQLSEHRQQITELKLRLDLQKERETDERDRTESRIRTLEVSLAKASDAESTAKSKILVLEEQIAEFEQALRADDREAMLANQIRENRELESRFLDAQKELKDKTVSLKKAEIELHYFKNEIERLRNIARKEREANPNSRMFTPGGAQAEPRAAEPRGAAHTPRAGHAYQRSTPTRLARGNSRVHMTPDGKHLPPHQPPPPLQPPPPAGTRTPISTRTPPPPPGYPRGTPRAGQGHRAARGGGPARVRHVPQSSSYSSSPLAQPQQGSYNDSTSLDI